MSVDRSVDLVGMVRDPRRRDYESEVIDAKGRLYIYRYLGEKGIFFRATVPTGAAAPVFRELRADGKVPLAGWIALQEKPALKPRLVKG
jgi:hypothetical protein